MGAGADARIALRRQIGIGDRQQGPTQAVTQRIDLVLASGLFDGIQRRQRPVLEIVVESLVGHLLVRIDPGHQKHREPLIHRPLDQGILRP